MVDNEDEVVRVPKDDGSVVIGFVEDAHRGEYAFYTVDNPEELFGELWPAGLPDNSSKVADILREAGKEPDVVIKNVAALI